MRKNAWVVCLLLAACGGGSDAPATGSNGAAPVAAAPTPAASPAPAPVSAPVSAPATVAGTPQSSAARGRALYVSVQGQVSCSFSGCHTASPSANVNNILRAAGQPAVIRAALKNPASGMGYLEALLTEQDLIDLATYLANPAAAG